MNPGFLIVDLQAENAAMRKDIAKAAQLVKSYQSAIDRLAAEKAALLEHIDVLYARCAELERTCEERRAGETALPAATAAD
jgi:hypothetical protein